MPSQIGWSSLLTITWQLESQSTVLLVFIKTLLSWPFVLVHRGCGTHSKWCNYDMNISNRVNLCKRTIAFLGPSPIPIPNLPPFSQWAASGDHHPVCATEHKYLISCATDYKHIITGNHFKLGELTLYQGRIEHATSRSPCIDYIVLSVA